MDEQNLWDFEEEGLLFLGLTDHSEREWFSSRYEVEEKILSIINVGSKSLEINVPIREWVITMYGM